MTRLSSIAAVLATGIGYSIAFAQAPAAAPPPAATPPVVSPFDKDDPEIGMIRSLDWKSANFDALDPKSKCLALMALNKGLSQMGAKADTRVDLLVDYIDQSNLGQVYASAKGVIPPPPNITFEQMEKVAAAYAQTPAGQAKLADQLPGTSADMLNMYLALYDKSARREFEETREARWQVRSMGLFIEQQGKLDDFKTWAIAEQKRRDEDLAKQAAEQQAKEQQARQERAQAYAQQKADEQQRAAEQMDMALQAQQSSGGGGSNDGGSSGNSVDNDTWWGNSPYGYYGGYYGYYNSNAYRGYVRDKAQDAYQRWGQNNPGRPSQLPAQRPAYNGGGMRGGGGGFRGGGRR